MDSSVTQGTSRSSIIFWATVVLPDALPPLMPWQCAQFNQSRHSLLSVDEFAKILTDDKRFDLLSSTIVPWRTTGCVNCAIVGPYDRFVGRYRCALIDGGGALAARPRRTYLRSWNFEIIFVNIRYNLRYIELKIPEEFDRDLTGTVVGDAGHP